MSLETGFLLVNKKRYEIVTIDFETFYSKEFTLSGKSINTSEYIRDDRFHAHGVSIKRGNRKTHWYTGKNIALALAEIDWTKSAMLAHNTPFDGFICSHHFKILPAFYLDTLSMARAAHSHHMRHDLNTIAIAHGLAGKTKRAALADTKGKLVLTAAESRALGAYCIDDDEDTYKIFWKLVDNIPDDELRLIDITVRMFCDPVLDVDLPRVRAELEKEIGGKQAALINSGADVVDLMSNDKFAALLAEAGAKLPIKISPSTGKMTYAFAKSDLDFQALGQSNNAQIAALCAARLKVKSTIGETRAVRFLEAGKDGMKLPVMLNYSGAHTHRWSGGNKLNLQNLVRGGELRKSILAPKGYVIVVADSAQIEARVLAWLAGQKDLIEAFRNKSDPYKTMASAAFNTPIEQITKDQRFIGKICVLGLGYGMGAAKLQSTLEQGTMGPPVKLTVEECQRLVNLYRSRNYNVKILWAKMDEIILAMLTNNSGQEGSLGPIKYGKGYIRLPNDLFLQYYGLHGEVEARRDSLIVREATYLTRMGKSKIYGGLLTENCLAEGTQVLTDNGWKKIQDITHKDQVHDGDNFVNHGGLLTKSVQPCVTIDGVNMTADHRVLTNEGWKIASQNPEPYRPNLWLLDGNSCGSQRWEKTSLGMPLRMRHREKYRRQRTKKRERKQLRVHAQAACITRSHDSRDVPASSICSMAINDRSMQITYASSMEKLRRAWDTSSFSMEHVPTVLERYGANISNRAYFRSDRQQRRIFSNKLPLGNTSITVSQQTKLIADRHTRIVSANRNKSINSLLSPKAQLTFDIVNAGPLQRFVVLGTSGPFIVHNCVQALSRCIIGEQILKVSEKYRVVTTTHDEIVVICKKKDADKCLADMLKIMSTPPDWAPGLPLAAEGGYDVNYSK